jgi:hypothetical protein
MKNYNILDVVELIKDIPEQGISKGDRGTILEVYNEQDFEVEVVNNNGKTFFLGTLSRDFFKLYKKYDTN